MALHLVPEKEVLQGCLAQEVISVKKSPFTLSARHVSVTAQRSPDILPGVGVDTWSTVSARGGGGQGPLDEASPPSVPLSPGWSGDGAVWVCVSSCTAPCVPLSQRAARPPGAHGLRGNTARHLNRHLALHPADMIHAGVKRSEVRAGSPRPPTQPLFWFWLS